MQRKLWAYRATTGKVRHELIGIGVSVAVLFLGASAANSQSAAPGNSNAAGLVTIRVAGGDAVNPSTPIFAAQKQGYFKEAGLNVTYATISGGAAPMAAALRAGEVDIGLGGTIQYMDYVARGLAPGKLIAELMDNANNIVGGKGITDIKQLKGKVIGVSNYNGGDQLYIQAVLQYYGIGKDDVTWLPIGIPASRLAALVTGRVDATMLSSNSMPESAKSMIILNADDSPVPQVAHTMFATQAILTSNTPALQRFVAAVNKGTAWVKAHPDEAVTPCLDTGSDAAACKIVIDALRTTKNPYTWSSTARLNTASIKAMIEQMAVDFPQAKNMTVADFVDTSIAGDGPP